MKALQAGDFRMKASRWPTLFYDGDVLFHDEDGTYDPNKNLAGLLQHHTVVRVTLSSLIQ